MTIKTRMQGHYPASATLPPFLRFIDGGEGQVGAAPAPKAPENTEGAEGAKPTEQLGEPGIAALQSERAARKAAEKRAAEAEARAQEYEDREKTDAQKAQDALTKAQQELAAERTARLRAEIAAAKGVPAHLLAGSTQEEMEKAADDLLAFKGTTEPAKPEPPASQTYVVPEENGKPVITKTESTRPGIGTLRAAYAESEGK